MTKNRQHQPAESSPPQDKNTVQVLLAKYGLIGTTVAAVLGLLGIAITAYFNYLSARTQIEYPVQITQTAEAKSTLAAQIATPTIVPPTLTAIITQEPQLVEPDQFIKDYYTAINSRQYGLSWSMLSPNFENEHNPTGFNDYKGFWDTVEKVEVQQAFVLERKPASATVFVSLTYTSRGGTVSNSEITFGLVFDAANDTWLINR